MHLSESVSIIKRLSCLPFFAALTVEARQELAEALADICITPAEGHEVIARWLRDQRELPTPTDLRSTAKALRDDADSGPVSPDRRQDCPRCNGTGWEPVLILSTRKTYPNGSVYTSFETITPATACKNLGEQFSPELAMLRYAADYGRRIDNTQQLQQARRVCACLGKRSAA